MFSIKTEEKKLIDLISRSQISDETVTNLLGKTSKFLYHSNILDRVYSDNTSKIGCKNMPNTILALTCLFYKSIQKCSFPNCEDFFPTISTAKKASAFDYQNCDSMKILKFYTSSKQKVLASNISDEIVKNLPANDLIKNIEVTGPGFINIAINPEYVAEVATLVLTHGVLPPFVTSRRVVVDLSSPNIAKEMHVGHLRSTIIGDSIARILEYVNFDVLRINHIGDWGTQFGMLIAHLEDKFPNYLLESPPIYDLQVFYKQSKKRFDEDEEFKKRAYSRVVQLQSGDADIRKAWTLICDISRKDYQKLYDRLDVKLEEKGESFYQSRMIDIVKELEASNKLVVEDGCKVIHLPDIQIPLLVVKSDGGFTYDTSDIATIKYRLFEQKADWILYVVDSGQADHFTALFKFAYMMNWADPSVNRIEHIGFGVVLGEDKKKFKTRSGETIKLSRLLDESVSRYLAKLKERETSTMQYTEEESKLISETIGYACVKYADLSKNLSSTYEFSFDRMLDDKGNTAVYLIYMFTRIRSIIRKSGLSDSDILEYAKSNPIKIESPEELKLLRKLVHFPEIVYRIVFDSHPHYLCEYAYDLCCATTEYYDGCQIITPGKDQMQQTVNMNRLCQIYSVSLVLKKVFELLGIETLEKM